MSILCKYLQGDKARFDFRISDGLGNFIEPDWDDPGLKVEFYDGAGTLRLTATKTSSPALASAEDASGKFLYVQDIPLLDFSAGLASARIYCQVAGAQVFPYPAVIEAFEVVAGGGAEPAYTTVTKVRNELPLENPAQLTDAMIEQFIYDSSRRIDAFLYGYYQVPFPAVEQNPPTPALIERLARKIAVNDCLVFLGLANQTELKTAIEEQALLELDRLQRGELRLAGNDLPVAVYQGQIFQDDPQEDEVLD